MILDIKELRELNKDKTYLIVLNEELSIDQYKKLSESLNELGVQVLITTTEFVNDIIELPNNYKL